VTFKAKKKQVKIVKSCTSIGKDLFFKLKTKYATDLSGGYVNRLYFKAVRNSRVPIYALYPQSTCNICRLL